MTFADGTARPAPPRPASIRFLLACAGEAEETGIPDHTGHSDPELSQHGRLQAAALAAEVARITPDGVAGLYTSPLKLAQGTAALMSETGALPEPVVDPGLTTIGAESLAPGSAGLTAFAAIQERSWAAIERLRQSQEPPATFVLLSHTLPVRALICRALAIPPGEYERFQVEPASLSILEFRGERTLLATLNQVCEPAATA